MLKFTILNPYSAGVEAGDAVREYDTTLQDDVERATAEFDRLLKEGRTALVEQEDGSNIATTEMPKSGRVTFLLPMAGG